MRALLKRYWPYLVVTLAIMTPLLVPGYVLTMDMVFVPHPPLPSEVNASYPFHALLHYLSYVIPGDVLQKIILSAIFLLMGVGMHRLLRQQFGDKASHWAIYAGALFYTVNPFVYERLMMGQFAVLGGYALLPFFIHSLAGFLEFPAWRRLRYVVGWLLLISIISVHSLVPAMVVALVLGGTAIWHGRNQHGYVGSVFRRVSAGIGAFLVASMYWLIPLFSGHGTTAAAVNGQADSTGFATQGGLFAILRLQGFWAEHRGLFTPVQDVTFLPIIGQLALWTLVVIGAVMLWRRTRSMAVMYLSVVATACVVAFGLIDFPGYREPHKITVLIAIGLAVLLCAGVQWMIGRIKFTWVGVIACALPLLVTPVLFWGGWGQLGARNYPDDWYAMNARLEQIDQREAVIFVPWHLYQRFSFSPRIIAHPAATFFDAHPVRVSDDPEFAGVQPLQSDSRKQQVGELLQRQPADILPKLRALGIDYIIFAREPGYEGVEFLTGLQDAHKTFTAGRLELYRIGAER